MPTPQEVHVNAALANLSIGINRGEYFIDRVLGITPVQKKSDEYFIYDSTLDTLREVDDNLTERSVASMETYAMTTAVYTCRGHGLKDFVTAEQMNNSDAALRPVADAVEMLMRRVLTKKDIIGKAAFDAAITQTSDPTNEWDDTANGDPFADINLAINTIEDNGVRPNKMWMDSKVFRALRDHPDIIDRIKYTGTSTDPAQIGPQAIAQLFQLDEVIVGMAVKNTAIKTQTAVLSRIWGSDVYIAYVDPTPGLMKPNFAHNLTWAGLSDVVNGFRVIEWDEMDPEGHFVKVSSYYDIKVTMANAAYRLKNRLT